MAIVTLSPKYQVVIPKEVRSKLRLAPGQKLQALVVEGHVVLIPLIPIQQARGLFKGIDTHVDREPDRL
ncbi:MAG: AbrB/MazE/SpoVT family DNA-binding domain-containing protein [Chloroflexi bacterium]|nr:AbrB/MazE/SpoVT family DNA-binding domain-containing protein [Chloroflexota bacterium]